MDFFGLFSSSGHCRRFVFRISVAHTSTFPASLRSTIVTRFLATTNALSSGPDRLFGFLADFAPLRMNTASGRASDPCLPSLNLPAVRSPTTSRCPRVWPDLRPQAYRTSLLVSPSGPKRLGLRLSLAGSPQRQAESSSSAYRPAVRLRLLSTPPCDDAVTFDYRGQAGPVRGLSPL